MWVSSVGKPWRRHRTASTVCSNFKMRGSIFYLRTNRQTDKQGFAREPSEGLVTQFPDSGFWFFPLVWRVGVGVGGGEELLKRFRWFQGVSSFRLANNSPVAWRSSLLLPDHFGEGRALDVHGASAWLTLSDHVHLLRVGSFSNRPPSPPPVSPQVVRVIRGDRGRLCVGCCSQCDLDADLNVVRCHRPATQPRANISSLLAVILFVLLGTVFRLAPSDCLRPCCSSFHFSSS